MPDFEIIYERGGSINVPTTTRRGKVVSRPRQIQPSDAPAFALQLRRIHEADLPQLGLSAELERFNSYLASSAVQSATGCTWEEAMDAVLAAMPELFAEHWMGDTKMPTNEQVYFDTLRKIAKGYQTPAQLRKRGAAEVGLGYDEAIEMAYENIQTEAAAAIRGKRRPKE